MTCPHTFSRAWCRLHVFPTSSKWFTECVYPSANRFPTNFETRNWNHCFLIFDFRFSLENAFLVSIFDFRIPIPSDKNSICDFVKFKLSLNFRHCWWLWLKWILQNQVSEPARMRTPPPNQCFHWNRWSKPDFRVSILVTTHCWC